MKLPRDLPAETSFRHWDHWGKRLRAKAEAQRHEPMSATFSMAYPLLLLCRYYDQPLRCTVWSPTRPRVRTGHGFDFRKRRSKYKSHPIKLDGLYILVEAAGIEPASASPLQAVLHT